MRILFLNINFLILSIIAFAQKVSTIESVATVFEDILGNCTTFGYPTENDYWTIPNSVTIPRNSTTLKICIAHKFVDNIPKEVICKDGKEIKQVYFNCVGFLSHINRIQIFFENGTILWMEGFNQKEIDKLKDQFQRLKVFYAYGDNDLTQGYPRFENPIVDNWFRQANELNQQLIEMRKCYNSSTCADWIRLRGGVKKSGLYIEEKTNNVLGDISKLPSEYTYEPIIIDKKNEILNNLKLMREARGY